MAKIWAANLVVSALAICTQSCLLEQPDGRRPADGDRTPGGTALAARIRIGSTEPVTWIRTLADLRAMRPSGNYKLANPIDASATENAPFVPIGYTKSPFYGTFDGNDFTIDKLTIAGTWDNTGLFSWAVNADLRKVRLTRVKVTGGRYTGAIAGQARNVDLKDSYVTGTVTGNRAGDSRVGLVFGNAADFVRISRCYATGTVDGQGRYFGGFIGYGYAAGIHDPNDDFRLTIEEVFTNVIVNPTMPNDNTSVYAGSLVGYLVGGKIESINAMGTVTGRHAAGGILGYVVNNDPNSKSTSFRSALWRGMLTDAATSQRAGTIGMSAGIFERCASFWDTSYDTGNPRPDFPESQCQLPKDPTTLKAPRSSPDLLINPYHYGKLLTEEDFGPNDPEICKLHSGSDGDWGFGTCGLPQVWALNSEYQYNTLLRIPNPGIQPR